LSVVSCTCCPSERLRSMPMTWSHVIRCNDIDSAPIIQCSTNRIESMRGQRFFLVCTRRTLCSLLRFKFISIIGLQRHRMDSQASWWNGYHSVQWRKFLSHRLIFNELFFFRLFQKRAIATHLIHIFATQ
jgi:hypothetical protein